MSENFISRDFLSKENTTKLYKQITISNELTNLSKQQKDFIVNQLIDTMKRIYKTLDLKKINETNLENIRTQYNSIIIKQISILIKNKFSSSGENNTNQNNFRNNERTFESVKRNIPNLDGVDRPTSSISNKPVLPSQVKISDEHIKKISGDVATRLAELENSRRTNNIEKPNDVPKWLQPEKVGKNNQVDIYTSIPNMPERKLEGIGGFEDNFKKETPLVDTSKYNDNMTLQDRLKQLEADRGIPVNNSGSTVKQSNVSDMFSNTIPYNSPQSSMSQSQYQPPTSQVSQYQSHVSNTPQIHQNPPPVSYQNPQILQQLNEMQQLIQTLKQDNDYLKSQLKNRQPNIKSLQLDINKKEANYNFQFSPINNIVALKLLSYNLPQPVYNIIENTRLIYKMNDIEQSIQIPKGNYTIENLLNNLNKNDDLIFSVDFTQKVLIKSKDETIFEILPNYLSFKLGFINKKNDNFILADRIYDLRMPSKLLLFIKNINENGPICALNFNNSSVCNLQFNGPISLSLLQLEFYTEDNILYNFNNLAYNLSFALEILD
jgi:hypothetical protein